MNRKDFFFLSFSEKFSADCPDVTSVLCCVGLRVLIYSGDHDMCVPHTGSEAWTRALGLKVTGAWHPWKVNHQVSESTVDEIVHVGTA